MRCRKQGVQHISEPKGKKELVLHSSTANSTSERQLELQIQCRERTFSISEFPSLTHSTNRERGEGHSANSRAALRLRC